MYLKSAFTKMLFVCIFLGVCVLCLGACSNQGETSTISEIEPITPESQEVERPKQQITITDDEGNEHTYDVTIEEIGGEDTPPYEGGVRMTVALAQDDAIGAVARAIEAITNRDSETLTELGVANVSPDSMESMYQHLKLVCSADVATVFLSNDAGVEPLAQINVVAPNYTTMIIAQHDSDNKWTIPFIPGMLEPGESFSFQSEETEDVSDGSEESEDVSDGPESDNSEMSNSEVASVEE